MNDELPKELPKAVEIDDLGLVVRLRSVADSHCEIDPWLEDLCRQAASRIEFFYYS
jgi:hypothetical protein